MEKTPIATIPFRKRTMQRADTSITIGELNVLKPLNAEERRATLRPVSRPRI